MDVHDSPSGRGQLQHHRFGAEQRQRFSILAGVHLTLGADPRGGTIHPRGPLLDLDMGGLEKASIVDGVIAQILGPGAFGAAAFEDEYVVGQQGADTIEVARMQRGGELFDYCHGWLGLIADFSYERCRRGRLRIMRHGERWHGYQDD